MRGSIPGYILTDSGFWFGLCDDKDSNHDMSVEIWDFIKDFHIVIPWPVTYEVLHTGFIKNRTKMSSFEKRLREAVVEYFNDQDYRESALDETIKMSQDRRRNISLVDMVIRNIIDDKNLNISYLVTFNVKDFVDVCRYRKIEIIDRI